MILTPRAQRRSWALWAPLAAWHLAAGCGSSSGPDAGPLTYLSDASYRRGALVASLVNPHNEYSALRLAHYATGDGSDWERLPEWNPPAERVAASELDAPAGVDTTSLSARALPLAIPATVDSIDDPALLALGEAAFSRYPAQVAAYLDVALSSRAAAQHYGLWVDDGQGVGGLVRARMADGSAAIAVTCSTCHAAPSNGAIAPGVPNRELDVGAAILDSQGSLVEPATANAIAAWGAGRLDVTTSTGNEPVRIPDLRPVRWLTYLQQDATVRARDIVALAIRIETLIITSNENAVRPPRVIALALAAYLSSLASSLPSESSAADASPRGASLFAGQCASCHVPPSLTGDPVALAVVGTDPTLGRSAVRGTGTYRVPSLHGVASRGPLLHDATVPSIDAMFDPARVTPAFTGKLHGSGAVPGHPFGLDLPDGDRAALVTYLRAL
jgi:cytochrome c553